VAAYFWQLIDAVECDPLFYLYVLIVRRWAPALMPRTVVHVFAVVIVLLVPKLVQEWMLHVEQLHPWFWFRQHFIEPVLGPAMHSSCITRGRLCLRSATSTGW
jgi:hypothetical protein